MTKSKSPDSKKSKELTDPFLEDKLLLGRYIKVIEKLAMNYGVANEKLGNLYSMAASNISDIWEDEIENCSAQAEKEVFVSQIEAIFNEIESRRLTEGSTLYFRRDVDESTQANRQFKLYLGIAENDRFSINLKKRSCSHLDVSENDTSIELQLKPAKKENNNRNPVGIQRIGIPHVDESKLDTLNGFHFIYGNCRCIYRFDSGKEIKINVSTRKEALRVINQLLKVVRPEVIKGSAAKNCKFPESSKSHHLEGIRADLVGIDVKFVSEGDFIFSEHGLAAVFYESETDELD